MNQAILAPYSYRREMPVETLNRVWWVVYKADMRLKQFSCRQGARLYIARALGKPVNKLWPPKHRDHGY